MRKHLPVGEVDFNFNLHLNNNFSEEISSVELLTLLNPLQSTVL